MNDHQPDLRFIDYCMRRDLGQSAESLHTFPRAEKFEAMYADYVIGLRGYRTSERVEEDK